MAPVAMAAASQRYGMSACLSANAAVYLCFGLLLCAGIARYMRDAQDAVSASRRT